MKKGSYLLGVLAALSLVGCGSSSAQPDEKKMHDLLGGPPSLKGMANKPKGAKQNAAGNNAQPPPTNTTSGP